MASGIGDTARTGCNASCETAPSAEALNRNCYCLSVDEDALRSGLEAELGERGLSQSMVETHPHLFASVPLFVSRKHIEQMARVIAAVEDAVATPVYRRAALSWAPTIAAFDPGSPGGLLGYDFHLNAAGPHLIEINTNPGGALLNALLGRVQRLCCGGTAGLAMVPSEPEAIEQSLFQVFISEWQTQKGSGLLKTLAIVDETPEQQFLYPEFLLFQQLLKRNNIDAVICDARDLVHRDARLWHRGQAIDFVYNRLTDFALELPAQIPLRSAYLSREVVLSPHPRAHALLADKRNLTLLSSESLLRTAGLADDKIATLLAGVPRTQIVTSENREALWAGRRRLFFKPATGYGSRAAYRGDKLTKRVWEEILTRPYVAQALISPSERLIGGATTPTALKVDLRCYAYAGDIKLVAGRLYQGQTTNLRTPGGGFAPVFGLAS